MRRTTALALLTLFALALVIAGCGSSDTPDEQLAKGKTVTVDGGKDGDIAISSSDKLPKGWPSEAQLPDDSTISTTSTQGDTKVVAAESKIEVDAMEPFFTGELTGWKHNDVTKLTASGGSLIYTKGDEQLLVLVSSGQSGSTLKYTVLYGPQAAAA
jgi:hypothetical protein